MEPSRRRKKGVSTPRAPKDRRISPARIFLPTDGSHVEITTTQEKATQTDSAFRNAAFQAYIIVNKFVELKQSVAQVQQLVVNLEVGPSVLSQNVTVEADEFESFLPFKSVELWEAFDSSLVDNNIFTKLLNRCKLIGGPTERENVFRILRALIYDEVAKEYSWEGAKGKRAFCNLNIVKLIHRSVRLHRSEKIKMATDHEINCSITAYIVHAPGRIKKRENKAAGASDEPN